MTSLSWPRSRRVNLSSVKKGWTRKDKQNTNISAAPFLRDGNKSLNFRRYNLI